ncbi:MAG TPA: ribosome assembly RNA-binding protein YhbY [Firmicutes bacterium]|nr:ribosome assembly RNA-binding protein YhbY [Bacillota bacterium]
MIMLRTKERAYLRSLANPLKATITLGKGEIDENVLKVVENALKAHELIKIKELPTSEKTPDALLEELAMKTGSEPVNRLGRILTLYRENKEKKDRIVLKNK